jgi:hypothetical protein
MTSRSSGLTSSTAGAAGSGRPATAADEADIASVRICTGPCAWCACGTPAGIHTARCGGTTQVPPAAEIASTPLLGYTICCTSW